MAFAARHVGSSSEEAGSLLVARRPVCEDRRPRPYWRIDVSDQAQLPGELLYAYTLKITQVVDYPALQIDVDRHQDLKEGTCRTH